MKRGLDFVRSRGFVAFNGALIVALLVWFVGPLISIGGVRPFDSWIVRSVVVALVFALWGGVTGWRGWRRRRAERELAKGITEAGQDPDKAASAEEVLVLRERLEHALDVLRRTSLGKHSGGNFLYQLPWYVFIGPPGAGKTTALANSELRFPLAEEEGVAAVRGVGGTRNCDWWFADEAVFIDTAGRYTTQDSNRQVDAAAWSGFLSLLKRTRPRQPLNGAIVSISLPDLALLSQTELDAHARTIKQRLRELYHELGVRFPVYVMFTKVDLVAGFTEFFDDLGREERQQVWGMTLPMEDDRSEGGAVAAFGPEFDLLVERLNARVVERMHQEVDVDRRSLIYGFPAQIASLKPVLERFLGDIFRPSRLEQRFLLRGVYLTSGTQEGTPIDRLMGTISAMFGLERQRLPAFASRGRSYFITRLLRDVVIAEAGLVSANPRVERRQTAFWHASAAAAVLVVALAGVGWLFSYQANSDLIATAEADVQRLKEQTAALPAPSPTAPAVHAALPPLETARNMPGGYAQRSEPVPVSQRLGLYQGDKIGSQAQAAYRRALQKLLLPRLMARLEGQMHSALGRPDFLLEALKVYLMLGGHGPLDADLVRQWMALDWEALYPGAAQENLAVRAALMHHLDAFLEGPIGSHEVDGALVERARAVIGQTPLPVRAYALIRTSEAARSLPAWRIDEHAGPGAAVVLRRRSGKPLGDGVPGLYTVDGYYGVFVPAVANVIRSVASESWVLGRQADIALNPVELGRLQESITDLYIDDYIGHWSGILEDLDVASFRSLSEGAEFLSVASGGNSPLRRVLQEIARQTTLTEPPEGAPTTADDAAKALTAKATQSFDARNRLAAIVRPDGAAPQAAPEQRVDRHFRALHEFVLAGSGGSPPADEAFQGLRALSDHIGTLAATPDQGGAVLAGLKGGGAAAPKVRVDPSYPPVAQRWLTQIGSASTALTAGGARKELNGIWTSEYLPSCRRAVEGRYPFQRSSPNDVPIDDFARVFAPGGLLDEFVGKHLRPFVDTTGGRWRWLAVEQVSFGSSANALAQFQRAATIRQAFFPAGSARPSVRFTIEAESLDPTASEVHLVIDGQAMIHGQVGRTRPVRFEWPGESAGEARVLFMPPVAGSSGVETKGPWAWFRLLDRAQMTQEASDRFRIAFHAGGRRAAFSMSAGSVLNPFSLRELESFNCPPNL